MAKIDKLYILAEENDIPVNEEIFMFYETFRQLCTQRGTTPTAVAKDIGISTSMTANWKKGGMPRGDTLQKLADYLDCSVDYLLGRTNNPDAHK